MNPAAPAGPVLRDIHLPPAPPWWPPAPGWWLVLLLALLVVVVLGWLMQRQQQMRRRRRRWLAELDRCTQCHARDGDTQRLLTALHQLLRRVLRERDPAVTHQQGEAWRRSLARVPVPEANMSMLAALETAIYRPTPALDVTPVLAAVRVWLQTAARPRVWRRLRTEAADV